MRVVFDWGVLEGEMVATGGTEILKQLIDLYK